jgi:CubicO group peptidase (beta-lactamase class C family)
MEFPHINTNWRITVLIGLVLINSSVAGQEKATAVKLGDTVAADIKSGETDSYTITLAKDQFFFATVNQVGVDLVIQTYDEKGDKIERFDSPNGKNGLEPVSIISTTSGEYRIDVTPLSDRDEAGNYTLEVKKIEPIADTAEGKVDQLLALWDYAEVPGAAISVVQNGILVNSKGYGIANLEYGIPISSNTVFHIASVSKQFTAFSIAMLADEGRLSLDDDIRKYLPEIHEFDETITIQHLIHHTSGLRDQWNLLAMAGWRLDDVITADQIMKLLCNQTDLNFKPGDEHLYCNSGYTLLAKIVEKVTGDSFAEWTRENIFKPLDMQNTLFYDDHQKIVNNRAYSYYEDSAGYKKSVLNYANVGATSLFTTVDDLSRWAINFENPKVGNHKIIEQMKQRGILNNGDTLDYAFGQIVGEHQGLKTISHSGGDAGYRSYLLRFPEQRFSVAVLSNLASFNTGRIARKISDIYLDEYFEKMDIANDDKKEEEYKTVDISVLNEYLGDYEIFPGFILTVSLENDHLVGQATGQGKTVMNAKTETEFFVPLANATIIFGRGENKEVDHLVLKQAGQEIKAPKLEEFDPTTVELDEFTGVFSSPELGTSYILFEDDGVLKAKHQRHPDFQLEPTKTDSFHGDVWFFGGVKFSRDQDGSIDGIKVSNGRVRNLWFEKIK